ncbi:helix-turn-helix transcriptional regulator [Clostridium sp. AM42-4]|jgi:transcriptional regulator with XRE-family HTH domain|uniref:helix-turn-helix domain-containing protein n=1 Tax=Clostridium sp. AM42-4 TaxID=2292305 RepID=UPI000E4B4538|nr:helix-turn-helix transcriptional regulator [Clostridium sp. AM42-4]RHS90183.1 XRE family transcriptional regulator [Clostridium sp. AM42-4]
MGLYEQIRDAAKAKGYSVNKLEQELGFARSSINKFNKNKPSIEKLQKIADFLGISLDYLTTGENAAEGFNTLTAKDEKDIEKILNQTREQLLTQDGLMFDGDPASPEAIESILSAMQIGMEMAKKKNKEKYTPKKYKKD